MTPSPAASSKVDVSPTPASAPPVPVPTQLDSTALAPKPTMSSAPNVTADSGEVRSLVSSIQSHAPTTGETILNMSAQSLVTMFAEAMSNIIHDVKTLPNYLDHHEDSSTSTVTSGVEHSRVSVPHSPHCKDPSRDSKSLPATLETDGVAKITSNTKMHSNNQVKFAKGPPGDPVAHEANNFASRKAFHSAPTHGSSHSVNNKQTNLID